MFAIYKKEIGVFFSSLIGYMVIGVFLVYMSAMMWFYPDTSVLNYNFATLSQLFELSPLIFMFLIPAITMRSFAEENQSGTIELLVTKPLKDWEIVVGKFLACQTLVLFALLPTLLYYFTVYSLGYPVGNIDTGATWGSYIGLFLLGASFVSIGVFSSSITRNQVVSFVLATFLCYFFYWAFEYISYIPAFVGHIDGVIQRFGISNHYDSMSRGLIDTRDLLYFFSVIGLFLLATQVSLESRKW